MNRYKLKDLSLSKLEYGSGAAACEYDGSTRYIRITDIDNEGNLGTDIVSPGFIENKYLLNDGDVLFARTGATVGKSYLYKPNDGRCIYAGFLIRVIPNRKLIRPDYLYYFTKSPQYKKFIQSSMKVVAQPNINAKQYGDLELNVPSLKEQNLIINKLASVSSIITLRKRELQKLDKLIKARFVELFGSVKEERLLGDISEFVTVGIANSATHAYAESGIPMLRNQNIKENHLDDTDLIYIKPEFAAQYESKKLKENDIIAMRTGYPGIACLVPKKYEGCQTFTTLIVRLKAGNNPRYVCSYINSDLGRRFIESGKVGVAQQNFGAKSLAKMPIRIPSKEMQNEYATFVSQVDKSKVA